MADFAISDIHGCSKTFIALLQVLKLSTQDRLFLLGDYINKGPDSKGVLDKIMQLKQEGYQINCLKGNHDQMLLDIQKVNLPGMWDKETQKVLTLRSFGVASPHLIPVEYLLFLDSLPLYVELQNHFLVHAGFDFRSQDPLLDEISMLNIKKFEPVAGKLCDKIIVHGHAPQTKEQIINASGSVSRVVKIDAGCVYYKDKGFGNLLALNMDTGQLIFQPNIDQPYDIGNRK